MSQGITHVVRGEEHLSNAPKQQLLWEALGGEPPVWAHVPVIVNEKRQKLSKRRDKVALEDYRAEGYLAEAMRNYLMLLGWAPSGDRGSSPGTSSSRVPHRGRQLLARVLRRQEAPRHQRRVHPGAAHREVHRRMPALPGAGPFDVDVAVFAELAPLAQTRLALLSEIVQMIDFAFLDEPPSDEQSWNKAMKEPAAAILAAAETAYRDAPGTPPSSRTGWSASAPSTASNSARRRRPSASPSPAAPSACRSSNPWRSSAATAPWPASPQPELY